MANVFGTLLHKKEDKQEAQALEKEGHKAISLQEEQPLHYLDDDDLVMVVGDERTVTQPHALEDPVVNELVKSLLRWINDVLEGRRLIVRDIVEDCYDGQVIGELISELSGETIDVVAVTQSSYMQKNKLRYLLDKIDKILRIRPDMRKWDVQSIHSKDPVAILHLLVALARYFRCPHPLPRNVKIKRIYLKQLEDKLETRIFVEEITGEDIGPTAPLRQSERDVFDKLFEEAPQKLEAVKKSLCQFCTKVLQELDIIITDLETQFQNGVNLVLMMGLLEGYYMPTYMFHYSPVTFDEKLDNVQLSFQLMEEAGLAPMKAKADDVVHKDLKSTLRVLYTLFTRYKSTFQPPQATPTSPTSHSAV